MARARSAGTEWHASAVGAFCFAVLLLWWIGFYPGISTVDSMQAWDQARTWTFQNWHPVFHTWVIAILTRMWLTPAVVTLTQIVGLSVVLGSLTRRLGRAGVRTWVTITVPCLIALSPQTGFTSIVVWKDIPFAISVLWMFAEVLDVTADAARFFESRLRCTRLGLAFLSVLLFRQNGTLVAGIVIVGIVVAYWRWWAQLALPLVIAIGGYVAVTGPMYTYLDAWPTPVLFTYTTFVHDMAAFVNYHADEMSSSDREFLGQILPIDRWKARTSANPTGLYYCRQATPLIFASEFFPRERFDRQGRLVPASRLPAVIVENPESAFLEHHKGEFRRLWLKFVRRWPGTFLGHRFCVGSVAWSPWHLTGHRVFEPPRLSTVRTPELQVRPLSKGVNSALGSVLNQWDRKQVRFLTWRAVSWIYLGFLLCIVSARRRRNWRFLVVMLPGFASWFSVLTFNPGQSARYLFPTYLCALASLAFALPQETALAEAAETAEPAEPVETGLAPAQQRATPGKGIRRIATVALALLAAALLLRSVVSGRHELADALAAPRWGALAAMLACAAFAMGWIAWQWEAVLRTLGSGLGRTHTAALYFVGEIGKYVPGAVWPVVGRAELATRADPAAAASSDPAPSRPVAYASVLLSLMYLFLAGLLCAAVAAGAAISEEVDSPTPLLLLLLLPVGVVCMHPGVAGRAFSVAERVLRRGRSGGVVTFPDWRTSITLMIRYVPAWLAIAGATAFAADALGTHAGIALIALAACLGWVAGFLVIPAPGGLGAREAVFGAVLGASVGSRAAAAVAVLARVAFVLVDGIGAAGAAAWLVRTGRRPRASKETRRTPIAPGDAG